MRFKLFWPSHGLSGIEADDVVNWIIEMPPRKDYVPNGFRCVCSGDKEEVVNRYSRTRDVSLDSEALGACQRAFDAILAELSISRDDGKAEDIAAFVIKLFQQGVRDEKKLFELGMAAAINLRV